MTCGLVPSLHPDYYNMQFQIIIATVTSWDGHGTKNILVPVNGFIHHVFTR